MPRWSLKNPGKKEMGQQALLDKLYEEIGQLKVERVF